MKRVLIPAVLTVMLGAAPVFAMGQAPATGQQPAPKPTQPAPTTPAPATQAPPTQPAAQPTPPRPFPEGAKLAYVMLPQIAQNSTEGRAASTRIEELQKKKQAELQDKNKQLQAAQQKLSSGGTVLNDAARSALEKDVDRMQREIQFAQQNAQAEVQDLTQELQEQFRQKLMPIIEGIGKERGLQVIFSGGDAGIIWADPGLDLTQEVIKRLDTAKPAAK
ncbi:MAG: OmpH family outer membrane protein [Acidobacteriota bacterium]